MKRFGFLIIGFLFLAGCSNCLVSSSRGTEVDTDDVEKIIIGRTTKAEIIGMFGVPDQVIARHGSDIDIQESTRRDSSRYDKDRGSVSGGVRKKQWDVSAAAGTGHGTDSGTAYAKTTSMSTPASAIASQGDVFVYKRITDKTWNLRVSTIESTTYETLTVAFDENDVVLSFNYRD